MVEVWAPRICLQTRMTRLFFAIFLNIIISGHPETKNRKIKETFTRVLKGHLNLFNFKIKKNTTGSILDKVARKSLRRVNLDYNHGTGHGVGFFLNVHEGPQSISKINKIKLKPGMILSNEPGYYEKDHKCEPCAYGTYQPNFGATSCHACNDGQNTTQQASTSHSQCVCMPGFA